MNIKTTVAIVITSFLFIPAASANTPMGKGKDRQQQAQHLLQMFDKNNDSVLDASELEAMLEARAQRKAKRKQRALDRFDQNGNGTLDPPERQAMAKKRFDGLLQRFDSNQDGALAWSEITAHADPRQGQGTAKGHGQGDRAKKLRRLFHAADTNSDNIVTRAEFQKALKTLGEQTHGPMGGHGQR